MKQTNANPLSGINAADDYARNVVPKNRWADTWEIFKANFVNLVIINVMSLLFFVPAIAVLVIREMYVQSLGITYPFGGNLGMGYPGLTDTTGMAESIYLVADLTFYSALIVAGLVAAIGISGGLYAVKRMLNSTAPFRVKHFFRGVRVGYGSACMATILFLTFLLLTVVVNDWCALTIAQGASPIAPRIAGVAIIIVTAIVGIFCMWLCSMGVSFKLGAWRMLRNTFVLVIGSIFQTIFFVGFSLIPVWLVLLGGGFTGIAYAIFIFFGFSFIYLVWMAFTQWIYDMYITPNVKAAKEDADSKKSPAQLAAEREEEKRQAALQLIAAGKSELIGQPIMPISEDRYTALPSVFDRAQLQQKVAERAAIGQQVEDYAKEHASDEQYVAYAKLFAEREKALGDDSKKGKKKRKVSRDNLLG